MNRSGRKKKELSIMGLGMATPSANNLMLGRGGADEEDTEGMDGFKYHYDVSSTLAYIDLVSRLVGGKGIRKEQPKKQEQGASSSH